MHIYKVPDSNLKSGRITAFFKNNKKIRLEYDLQFSPFNFNFSIDSSENSYTLSFWFIFKFYLSFNNIFNTPKFKHNIYIRNIGISQHKNHLMIYIWHDGEAKEYNDGKIFYKYINFNDIFLGEFEYKTIKNVDSIEYIKLPEDNYQIEIHSRYFIKEYKRFYMKIFNINGISTEIYSNIKYPIRKFTNEDIINGYNIEDLERIVDNKHYLFDKDINIDDILTKYKNYILKLRSCEDNWVPSEYRNVFNREEKLRRILNEE